MKSSNFFVLFLLGLVFSCSAPSTGGVSKVSSVAVELSKESLDGTLWLGEYATDDPDEVGGARSFVGIIYHGENVTYVGGHSEKAVLDELKGEHLISRNYTIRKGRNQIIIPMVDGRDKPYLRITYLDENTLNYEQVPSNTPGEHAILKFKEKIPAKS